MNRAARFEPDEVEFNVAIAAGLVESYHLGITINGKPHMPVQGLPLTPCAHCGAELPKASNATGKIVRLWCVTRENPVNLIMNNASNPLSRIRGFPITVTTEQCPKCKEKNTTIAQLIL
jgi:hypothetical protein